MRKTLLIGVLLAVLVVTMIGIGLFQMSMRAPAEMPVKVTLNKIREAYYSNPHYTTQSSL